MINKTNRNFKISKTLFFLFLLFLYFAAIPCQSREMGFLRCKRDVVDSVKALDEMQETVRSNDAVYQGIIDKYTKSVGNEELIDAYKAKIRSIPDSFSADVWYEILGDSDISLKTIDYEREAYGEDCYTFMELVESFFPREEEKERFQDKWTVVGKFEGLLKDRIGIFPVVDDFEDYRTNNRSSVMKGRLPYNKILIKSMRETVPSLFIPLGFETSGETVFIQTINAYWDDMDRMRDGFCILFYDPVKSKSRKFYYFFDGKEWKMNKPKVAEVLTFDETIKRADECKGFPIFFTANVLRNSRTNSMGLNGEEVSFMFVEENDIGGETMNRQPMLKYEILKNGRKVTGNCYLEMPWVLDVFVHSNYQGTKNDVIVVEYYSELRYTKRVVYLPVRENSIVRDGLEINGEEFDNSIYLKKIAEGTLNHSTNTWSVHDVF